MIIFTYIRWATKVLHPTFFYKIPIPTDRKMNLGTNTDARTSASTSTGSSADADVDVETRHTNLHADTDTSGPASAPARMHPTRRGRSAEGRRGGGGRAAARAAAIKEDILYIIRNFRGPLFRGPLIISLYVRSYPALAKCLYKIRIYKLIMRGPLTGGP